jgi:uncharacterized protein YcnI
MNSANPSTGKRRSTGRQVGRATLACAGAAALVVVGAVAADAHVTVHSKDAKPGGSNATLVFNVPNEEDNAKTVKIEIDFPTATPLTGVTAQAPTGWTAATSADKVVFSGGSISGDDSVKFPIKVGQLPKVNSVVFKALQTYSNGDVVRWIDQAAPGGPEAAHPAPTLDLLNPSKLSDDEIADMKADAAKDAAKDAKPAAKPASTSAPAATKAKADPAAPPAAPAAPAAKPTKVHAGTGGQASESGGTNSTVPLGLLLAGLGVAGLAGARVRVARRR